MSSLNSENRIKRGRAKGIDPINSYLMFPDSEETKENTSKNQINTQRANKVFPKPKPIVTNNYDKIVHNSKQIFKFVIYFQTQKQKKAKMICLRAQNLSKRHSNGNLCMDRQKNRLQVKHVKIGLLLSIHLRTRVVILEVNENE